jgi:hypothetical protein
MKVNTYIYVSRKNTLLLFSTISLFSWIEKIAPWKSTELTKSYNIHSVIKKNTWKICGINRKLWCISCSRLCFSVTLKSKALKSFSRLFFSESGLYRTVFRSRIHERTISLRFLDKIVRVLRLGVFVYNVYITNQFQTTFAQGGGGRVGVKSVRRSVCE